MSWSKHKVSFSMGMSSGGAASTGEVRHQWRIKIDDTLSGVRICEIELSLEQFARALGHHYLSEVDAELLDADSYTAKVGKRHDTKAVLLPLDMVSERAAALAGYREAIKPFLVDGWQSPDLDTYNWHHAEQSTGTYRVTLHRWVDPATPKPESAPLPLTAGRVSKKSRKGKK